ncbi:polycystin-1-like protein 2 [Centroberyx affinis]|uniref:polycystin-1-like protein 2 n=1 Tax=Centroberyx affinis TaxID=166261 RepID=UPI003A5BCA9F
MYRTVFLLLILMAFSCLSCADDETEVVVSCPEHQEAFGGSCYEFVGIQRSFLSAQAWCEQSGGHLAFIRNEETQYFLQKHLDLERDWWLGLAPSAFTNLQDSTAAEGPLSWLDGSEISYSNWVSRPQTAAGCGHILRNSAFQWEATGDCSKKLHFVCQFESGRSIMCAGHNAALHCSSGQVIEIDGGFYGRKTVHYCRSTLTPPTTSTQCGWMDIVDSLAGQCQGRQVCQAAVAVDSLVDPCPGLGSYLSVDYHCKDGLNLSMSELAAVFDDVTISVKWLLRSFWGDLTCKLSTGDGHIIYLNSPDGLESSVVHKYIHPSVFVVGAECTSNEIHITAQKIITIQDRVTEFGVIKCYAMNLSLDVANCKALYGRPFQIQMEVEAGTNMTYRIQSGEMLLSNSSVVRGIIPHNITVSPETVEQLGLGCHQLTIHASNMVTFPGVSTDLQVCVLEEVAGLQALVVAEEGDCPQSPDLNVSVSLERGVPVLLLFSLTGDSSCFSETREMLQNTQKEIYHIRNPIQEHPCKCQGKWQTETHTIKGNCLPDPFQYFKYKVKATKEKKKAPDTASICITFMPKFIKNKLSCEAGCDPVNENTDVKIKLECDDCQVVWNIEDPRQNNKWEAETKSCYKDKKKKPLIEKQDGGIEYTVKHNYLTMAKSKDQDVVVVAYSKNKPLFSTYTIKISSSAKNPAAITKTPFGSVTTAKPKATPQKPSGATAGTANKSPGSITTATKTPSATSGNSGSATKSSSATSENSGSTTKGSSAASGNSGSLSCSISPPNGTVLDAFNITCKTEISCPNCQYCFKTDEGKHLRCSKKNEVKSVFLPSGASISNYSLTIVATAKTGKDTFSTTITTQVLDSAANSSSSVKDLQSAVKDTVAQLKDQGLLSGETLGQMFHSVAAILNGQSDKSQKAARQKLREQMLNGMMSVVTDDPSKTPQQVQVMARGLAGIVKKGTELSLSAQKEASLMVASLSSSLLLDAGKDNKKEIHTAAITIVEAASNILAYASNKSISDDLLNAMNNIQSALLKAQKVNEGAAFVQQDHIGVLVQRVTPGNLQKESIHIPQSSSPSFSLPSLLSNIIPSEEPVDVRMLSLKKNPFSWSGSGNISGLIGALSLARENGSNIPVENLTEDIEVLLPRPIGEQVNNSVLDLRNYSTMAINVPSPDTTLVLKMEPSEDPLPFKLFLGHKEYPTDTNYVAMTQMPHQGDTQEERYTWLLDPKDLKGNTGVHYLVVRPIVGPGIKFIDASLSITSIASQCKYWDESQSDWSDNGCRVGVQTTHLVTQCLCNHLTFFGSSFFVTPNLVDPSRTAELFATFAENPVVVCFVGALFVAYLLVLVWARRKDIQDTAKVKVMVLEDNDPMDEYRYMLSISTGHRRGASTSSQVMITLLGAEGDSEPHHLTDPEKCVFERGAVDVFLLTTPFSLGDLQSIRLWHNSSGGHPAWYVNKVMVQDLQTEQKWQFLCNSWLAIDVGDCTLDKVFPVATEVDLKKFSNLFFMKTTKDFSDGHLWFSVISRPPSSTFTCVQRVSCCFSLLLCTMLTSIMFWGIPTDPSEQTMDLGHFEFTWQQFMIGIQSSLIMFPVNLLIVSIFRNTRPREMSCFKPKPDAEQENTSQTPRSHTAASNMDISGITLDTVIKDITRIAHSLSKTVKSNIPHTESKFGPGQVDINAVLSVVEDFIRQNNKIGDATANTHSKTQGSHNLIQTQLPESGVGLCPETTAEGIQKKSNKSQYLYRQLCQIDTELSLLGPSGFPTSDSYSQAVQQVQDMKGLLEDQLFTSSFGNLDQQPSAAESSDSDSSKRRQACCEGGLPWWFVFIGWLLVITTSCVAGYFTMLYGLKFGKERSISWLISMVVSFFQSLLIIQPLKVLCLAVFFALVLKKVEEEDYENLQFVKADRNPDDHKVAQTVRRDSRLYQPPPPADIERMRRNKIKEQKAFALIWEILTYMGFMWMLLLLAYGQRDPNAFFLSRHIRQSFSKGISDSMSLRDVFTWANTSLLSNLFGVYPGFITDGNSKLVGNARLRQVRAQKNSCQIAGAMHQFVPDCHAPYSWELEDMGSYSPGWNHSVGENISQSHSSPWKYQTQAQLRAYAIWGKMVLYRGGGFVVELGPDSQHASSVLEYLFKNTWFDAYTRAIFIEFTVYNANVNLFCIVTLLLETTAVGAFQFRSELQSVRLYQSTGSLHIFVMAAEVIYLLFILYYMFLQGKLMKQHRWAYFRSVWNLLELTIILLSWSAMAIFIKRAVLGNRDMAYYHNHKHQFASFHDTASADSVLQYLIAFLVLLATVKLWHLFRLNSKLNMITATLQRAWADISGFLVIMLIMFLAYSITCNLLYGWKLSSYKTLMDSLLNMINLQVGIFNYEEVLNYNLVLSALLIGSCIVFMTFVVLNLFISVILMAFSHEQMYHKPSEEEEIVDLMLNKLCSLFGISLKETKDSTGPEANDSVDLGLNNGKTILNNSSIEPNIFQTSDNSENS